MWGLRGKRLKGPPFGLHADLTIRRRILPILDDLPAVLFSLAMSAYKVSQRSATAPAKAFASKKACLGGAAWAR